MNGGPETVNLNADPNQSITAQKRYKMELQAEINMLRERYKEATKKQDVIENENREGQANWTSTASAPKNSPGSYPLRNVQMSQEKRVALAGEEPSPEARETVPSKQRTNRLTMSVIQNQAQRERTIEENSAKIQSTI